MPAPHHTENDFSVAVGIETATLRALPGPLGFAYALQRGDAALSPFDYGAHVLCPQCQRFFSLIAIPIVDRFDAALDVIDRKLGDVRRYAEPSEACSC